MNALGGDTIKSQARMVQPKLRNKHSEEGTGDEPTSPKPRDCDRFFLAGGCKTVGADSHGSSYTTTCVVFGRRSPRQQTMPRETQPNHDQPRIETVCNYITDISTKVSSDISLYNVQYFVQCTKKNSTIVPRRGGRHAG